MIKSVRISLVRFATRCELESCLLPCPVPKYLVQRRHLWNAQSHHRAAAIATKVISLFETSMLETTRQGRIIRLVFEDSFLRWLREMDVGNGA